MSTSGTFGQTVIDVQTLIDHGARRCGKLAEELTSEQQLSARQSLYYLLSNLANRGIQYWAISKQVIGMQANKYIYSLPVGSVDVLNALYRRLNRPTANSTGGYASSAGGTVANAFDSDTDTACIQTSANGNISVNYGTANPIYAGSIGVLPYVSGGGSASWTFTLEYSTDGATWTVLYNVGTVTVTDNQWLWYDIDPGQSVQYYRINVSGGTTLALREFYLHIINGRLCSNKIWGSYAMVIHIFSDSLKVNSRALHHPWQKWFHHSKDLRAILHFCHRGCCQETGDCD